MSIRRCRFQVAKTELEVASISKAVSLAKIQPYRRKMQPGFWAKQKEESESQGLSLCLSVSPPTRFFFILLIVIIVCVGCVCECRHTCVRGGRLLQGQLLSFHNELWDLAFRFAWQALLHIGTSHWSSPPFCVSPWTVVSCREESGESCPSSMGFFGCSF